jgi:hypothetical protein
LQNKSHAVMAQRHEPSDAKDDFPTPPWATRALVEHVLGGEPTVGGQSCLEPACGRGHMARALSEYFGTVRSSDAYDYGFAPVRDFVHYPMAAASVDWVITNPPFKLGEQFIQRGLQVARIGVAMLVRTVFIESVGRYQRLFKDTPPSLFAQFVERVPIVRGRVDISATTATGYAWLVWEKRNQTKSTSVVWIPPCRRQLEREDDYSGEDVRKKRRRG